MARVDRPTKREELQRGTARIRTEKDKVRQVAAPMDEDVRKRYRGSK